MVKIEKYQNDGWGLSKKCFLDIFNIIKSLKSTTINVVEFGSGISTEFFVDLISDGYDVHITSFDNDEQFATKIRHNNLNLHITDLIECYDSDFDKLFQQKIFDRRMFFKKISPVNTRQTSTFYDVSEEQLPKVINVMVVDGPHGNGRSIAFLLGKNRLLSGSFVVIDDYNHYDFVNKFQIIFPESSLVFESTSDLENKWESGGNYVIYRID